MCSSAEMNGYAFCSGLNKLGLSSYPGLQGLIRSAVYLIRGAIFRPRYAMSLPSRVSLGELIDMYHNREATRRHDKIYALLGMSSEGPSAAGLSPNYQVSWKELLQRLVGFLLYNEISVETWNERDIAVIKTKGFILGQVSSVESDSARYDRQHVAINFKNTSRSSEYRRKWGDRWTLQASAKPIQNSDLVCLLQGALKPTIIRTRKDHFAVIVIAVTPRQGVQTESRYVERQGSLPSMESFSRDFLLVWNWDESNETLAEINTLVSEYSMIASNKITSLYNVALILQDAEEYEETGKRFQEIIEASEGPSTEEHLYKLAYMENPAFIYKKKNQLEKAEDLFLQVIQTRKRVQGVDHPDTLSSIANLASIYVDEGRLSIETLEMMEDLLSRVKHNIQILEEEMVLITKSFGKEILTLLLVLKRDNVGITEEMLKAAAGNLWYGHEVMALLLDRGGDNIQITEMVLKAAVGNLYCGYEVITLLLDRRGDDIQITEEVLKAAAGNTRYGLKVIALLLDRGGDDIQITEEVLKEAAGNAGYRHELIALLLNRGEDDIHITEEVLKAAVGNWHGHKVIKPLLDRGGDSIQITEGVLKAAAGNPGYGDEVMALLLDRGGDDIQITEEVLKAAVGNPGRGEKIMALLLDQGGDGIQITEEVLKVAAGNWHEDDVITLLLNRGGDNIQITEEALKVVSRKSGV
jgi:tetratricopeptide (TPR) repeat protein